MIPFPFVFARPNTTQAITAAPIAYPQETRKPCPRCGPPCRKCGCCPCCVRDGVLACSCFGCSIPTCVCRRAKAGER